jgi:hypothetical protein
MTMNEHAMTPNGATLVEASKMTFDDLAKHSNRIDAPDLVDKETLLGKELVVIDAQIRENGDYGPYASITCKLRDGSLVVFNDGSTGCYKQIESGAVVLPCYCSKGLRKSTYDNPTGQGKAETYYFSR